MKLQRGGEKNFGGSKISGVCIEFGRFFPTVLSFSNSKIFIYRKVVYYFT